MPPTRAISSADNSIVAPPNPDLLATGDSLAATHESWPDRALAGLAIGGLALMPFAVTPGYMDTFRLAKELLLRAQGIIALFLLAAAMAYAGSARFRELLGRRAVVGIVAGALLWTLLTTLTSTHRLHSGESLATVVFSALVFLGVWYASRRLPLAALAALVPGAIANTILIALQEYGIWNPFRLSIEPGTHLASTAFIGNPNDVGAYLAIVTVVLLVAAGETRSWMRWLFVAGSVFALAGVFISLTRTAVIAVGAAFLAMAVRRSYKAGIAIAVLFVLALIAAARTEIPALTRLLELPKAVADGRWNEVASDRVAPFLAAAAMFRDRPLVGLGPGTYKYHYMQYRSDVGEAYPRLEGSATIFAETHNDHLQLLAETGIPGYALFLVALALVALHRRRNDPSERVRFADALGVPFAVCVFVLCLASFPLQLAATRHLMLSIGALIVGWRQE